MWEQLAPYDEMLDKTAEVALAQDASQIEDASRIENNAQAMLDAFNGRHWLPSTIRGKADASETIRSPVTGLA